MSGDMPNEKNMSLSDVFEETNRIMQAAEQRRIVLRLIGGLAIGLRCPSAKHRGLIRNYPDIDFISHAKLSKQLQRLFRDIGYEPAELFNALQGKRRLLFLDEANKRRVDVFLDVFEMCHRLDFSDRLEMDRLTLTPADLLATKLQVVEINEKDYKDTIALILDHEIAEEDKPGTINGKYVARLCAKDWGIYKTFTRNIRWISDALEKYVDAEENRRLLRSRIERILDNIEGEPKSMRWKMRAAIGDKVPWYELPEGRA